MHTDERATVACRDFNGMWTAVSITRLEALTLVGIFEQPERRRLECGAQLAKLLDELKATRGIRWRLQPVEVRTVRPASGITTATRPPITAGLCLYVMYVCAWPRDEDVTHLVACLNRFIAGERVSLINPFTTRDVSRIATIT